MKRVNYAWITFGVLALIFLVILLRRYSLFGLFIFIGSLLFSIVVHYMSKVLARITNWRPLYFITPIITGAILIPIIIYFIFHPQNVTFDYVPIIESAVLLVVIIGLVYTIPLYFTIEDW